MITAPMLADTKNIYLPSVTGMETICCATSPPFGWAQTATATNTTSKAPAPSAIRSTDLNDPVTAMRVSAATTIAMVSQVGMFSMAPIPAKPPISVSSAPTQATTSVSTATTAQNRPNCSRINAP